MLTCSYSFCYKVSGIVMSIKHLMARPLIGDQFPNIQALLLSLLRFLSVNIISIRVMFLFMSIHFSAYANYYLADLSHFYLRPHPTTSSYIGFLNYLRQSVWFRSRPCFWHYFFVYENLKIRTKPSL